MSHECSVCCDDFPQKDIVICLCGFEVCKKCTKTYMLSSLQCAHCMKCKVGWGVGFLARNFTKSWLIGNKEGQYRHKRKNVAFDREKARIPDDLKTGISPELPKLLNLCAHVR